MKTTKQTEPTANRKFTKTAFADALGISRQALNVHLKAPDAPPIGDLDAWQIYLAAHGRIGSAPDDLRRAIAQERLDILKETKAKLARQNKVEDDLLMPVADAKRQNSSAWNFVFSELERFQNELPPILAGLSAVEIYKHLHAFTERMRADAIEKFNGK